jgi:hypothetical protein
VCVGFKTIANLYTRLLPVDLSNRTTVIEQLRNVEVSSAEKVTVEWTLKTGGNDSTIVGRADSGRVKLHLVGDALKILLRTDDVEAARAPLEFREEMTKFCGIVDSSHITLLDWILTESDISEIEDALQRRNVPDEVPEFDKEADPNNRSKRELFDVSQRRLDYEKSSLNAMQSFVDRFNLASSFKSRIAQPWEDTEVESMLSYVCRLENLDPFWLLPQKGGPAAQKIRQAGGQPDGFVGVFFDRKSDSHYKYHLKRNLKTFPAIVSVAGNGKVQVNVSNPLESPLSDDVLFAGELYVGILPNIISTDMSTNHL